MKTQAQRMRDLRLKKTDQGLIKVELWVRREYRETLKKLEKKYQIRVDHQSNLV